MRAHYFFFLIILTLSISGCVSHDAKKIANELCECKQIEKYQGALKGEQCFNEWDRKYGKIRFDEAQIKQYEEVLYECNEKND